jgi:hypothetical protein
VNEPPVNETINLEAEAEPTPAPPQPKPCRHEHVRIYQRKLKGLERRLVRTRAWSPVGFKVGDFSHLGDNSYCFCSGCRMRLYPRRTVGEKLAAKLALAQGRLVEAALSEVEVTPEIVEALNESESSETAIDIHVEELELESVDAQDIAAEGIKLTDDEQESCLMDEDI